MMERKDLFDRKRLQTLLKEFVDEVEEGVDELRREAGPQAQRFKQEGFALLEEFFEELEKGARSVRTRMQQVQDSRRGEDPTNTYPPQQKTSGKTERPDQDMSGACCCRQTTKTEQKREGQKPQAPDKTTPESLLPAYGPDLRHLLYRDFGLGEEILDPTGLPVPGSLQHQIGSHENGGAPGAGWYLSVLGETLCPTVVFLHLHHTRNVYSKNTFEAMEEALLAGWRAFQGQPVPQPVRKLLKKEQAQKNGDRFIRSLEILRRSIFQSTLPEEAKAIWGTKRIQTPLMGVAKKLTPRQVAIREFWVDLCLLQWGGWKDVQRAQNASESGRQDQPKGVCAVLNEMDRQADLLFEEMLGVVLKPEDQLLEQLDGEDYRKLQSFARKRPLSGGRSLLDT